MKWPTLTFLPMCGDGTYLWAMLPFLMSEMMRGLLGFLLARKDRNTYLICKVHVWNECQRVIEVSPPALLLLSPIEPISRPPICPSPTNFPPKPVRAAKVINEHWYRPVLFSFNEGCDRVVLQDWILRITKHWFKSGTRGLQWIFSEQHCHPVFIVGAAQLTTDDDAQVHSSPCGQLDVESSTAGNHRLW